MRISNPFSHGQLPYSITDEYIRTFFKYAHLIQNAIPVRYIQSENPNLIVDDVSHFTKSDTKIKIYDLTPILTMSPVIAATGDYTPVVSGVVQIFTIKPQIGDHIFLYGEEQLSSGFRIVNIRYHATQNLDFNNIWEVDLDPGIIKYEHLVNLNVSQHLVYFANKYIKFSDFKEISSLYDLFLDSKNEFRSFFDKRRELYYLIYVHKYDNVTVRKYDLEFNRKINYILNFSVSYINFTPDINFWRPYGLKFITNDFYEPDNVQFNDQEFILSEESQKLYIMTDKLYSWLQKIS